MTLFDYYLKLRFDCNHDGAEKLFTFLCYILEEIRFLEFKEENLKEILEGIFNDNQSLSGTTLFYRDELIGFILAQWISTKKFEFIPYKDELQKIGDVFKMIFLIIEESYEEFLKRFPSFIANLPGFYEKRYQNNNELFTKKFIFILLMTAIN